LTFATPTQSLTIRGDNTGERHRSAFVGGRGWAVPRSALRSMGREARTRFGSTRP
jgi:hypothetical protein